jgi:hypothetical protein
VSDSPSYLPPYIRASRSAHASVKPTSGRPADDLEDDPDADDLDREDDERPPRAATAAPIREGLPPTYRMRHEAHYVEALVGGAPPPAATPVAAAAPAPLPAAPAPAPVPTPQPPGPATVVAAATAPETAPARPTGTVDGGVFAALAASLDAIEASLRDVSQRGRPLRERVAVDLARAEAARARWTAEASALLQSDPLPSLDEVDLAGVCRAVSAVLAPEYRLTGGGPASAIPASPAPVFGDERLLQTAVGALLTAVRLLVEDRGDLGRIVMVLAPRTDTATRSITVTQAAVRLPAGVYPRCFDAAWSQHPAGLNGALLFAAAQRIAVAHGGGLEVTALDEGGCRFTMSLPAAG